MPAARRGIGCIESAGAAARHEHATALASRSNLKALELTPDERVHGAAARGGLCALGHAGKAAQAVDDLVLAALAHLARQLGVGQELACHVDDIGLARGDDLFHLRGVVDAADRRHGDAHAALDLGCKVHVGAVLFEHGGVRVAKAALIGAGAHMQKIDFALELVGDGRALQHIVAALEELRAAHAELDGEPLPHRRAHRVEHARGKTAAVLERAAVLVRAMVEVRRKELVDEPAVPTVDHDHAKARALGKARHMAVGRHDLVDLFMRKLAHLNAVRTHRGARPPLAHLVLARLVRHVRARIHTRMRELKARHRAVARDGIGRIGGARERV